MGSRPKVSSFSLYAFFTIITLAVAPLVDFARRRNERVFIKEALFSLVSSSAPPPPPPVVADFVDVVGDVIGVVAVGGSPALTRFFRGVPA